MGNDQIYIGARNGAVLCVDGHGESELSGRLYHGFRQDAELFATIEEALEALEALFDSLKFPFPGNRDRSFAETKPQHRTTEKRNRIMSDESLLTKHGELGTFIIRVQQRQNSSWQGRITWTEKKETLSFRSTWEMVKLIESAIDIVCHTDSSKELTWADGAEGASEAKKN